MNNYHTKQIVNIDSTFFFLLGYGSLQVLRSDLIKLFVLFRI